MRTTASIFRIRTKQFILGCPRGSTTLRAKRPRTAGKQHEHKLRIRLQIRSPVGQIRVYTCNITFANFAKSFAKIHAWISKNICKKFGVDLQKYSAKFAGDICLHTSRTKRIFMVAATSICGPKTADFDAKIALKEVPFTPTEIRARRIWQMVFPNMSPIFLQMESDICKIRSGKFANRIRNLQNPRAYSLSTTTSLRFGQFQTTLVLACLN